MKALVCRTCGERPAVVWVMTVLASNDQKYAECGTCSAVRGRNQIRPIQVGELEEIACAVEVEAAAGEGLVMLDCGCTYCIDWERVTDEEGECDVHGGVWDVVDDFQLVFG